MFSRVSGGPWDYGVGEWSDGRKWISAWMWEWKKHDVSLGTIEEYVKKLTD